MIRLPLDYFQVRRFYSSDVNEGSPNLGSILLGKLFQSLLENFSSEMQCDVYDVYTSCYDGRVDYIAILDENSPRFFELGLRYEFWSYLYCHEINSLWKVQVGVYINFCNCPLWSIMEILSDCKQT